MKEYDKNSLIGFVLMAIILIVFNTFFFPTSPIEEKSDVAPIKVIENTSEINQVIVPTENTNISEEQKNQYGIFANNAIGEEALYTLENEKLKITISNKGGRIVSAILKEYQTYDSLPLDLFNADSSKFNLQFSTGKYINTEKLFFEASTSYDLISMKLKADEEHYIEYIYSINDDDFLIDLKLIWLECKNLFHKS